MDSLDTVFLYFPIADPDLYVSLTGLSDYHKLFQIIELCKEKNTRVILNHPIRSESAAYISDAYNLARDYQIPILYHYDSDTNMTDETMGFIHRFYHVPNAWVFKNKTRHIKRLGYTGLCSGVSPAALFSPTQWAKNAIYEQSNRIRTKFKL